MMLNRLIGKIRLFTGDWILSTPSALGEGESNARFCFRPIPNKTWSCAGKLEEGMLQMAYIKTNKHFIGYKAFPAYCLYIQNVPK